jgi:tRNA threonylcarbamoyladenosine biosynthesis protein TsaE
MSPLEFITHSENETFLLAQKLGASLHGDEIILLVGDLGTGKTVFAKGLASGLGLKAWHHVCSPSYTLINIYEAKVPIVHLDLYRLGSDAEVSDLGWEDYIGEAVVIIEWADRMPHPENALKIQFIFLSEKGRRIIITSPSPLKIE